MTSESATDSDDENLLARSRSGVSHNLYVLGSYQKHQVYSALETHGDEDGNSYSLTTILAPGERISPVGRVSVADKNDLSTQVRSTFKSIKAWFRHEILRSGPVGYEEASPKYKRLSFGLTGWRLGILVSTVALVFCLVIEIALLITAITITRNDPQDSTLYEGSCQKVKKYTLLIMIPFNIVGTLMVGCSNYVMQIVSSPSRKELDAAHIRGKDLNIGTSSAQNYSSSAPHKQCLWWIFGLTTVPVHLMLNSIVFATLQSNKYAIVVAGQDFLNASSDFVCQSIVDHPDYNYAYRSAEYNSSINSDICYVRNEYINAPQIYEALDSSTCLERYRNPLQGTASNLLLITDGNESVWKQAIQGDLANVTSIDYEGQLPLLLRSSEIRVWSQSSLSGNFSGFGYNMLESMNVNDTISAATNGSCEAYWAHGPVTLVCQYNSQVQNLVVQKCFGKITQEHCTIQYSLTILISVLACDVAKLLAMCFLLRRIRRKRASDPDDEIIAVFGDAIASYLSRPDDSTANRCLIDQRQIRAAGFIGPVPFTDHSFWREPLEIRSAHFLAKFGRRPEPWKVTQQRWSSCPSRSRWGIFNSVFLALFVATSIILGSCLTYLDKVSVSSIWDQGLGQVDPSNIFASDAFSSSLVRGILVINTPQLLFSILYFTCNGLFTCMYAGHEWSQFAGPNRRLLRVSAPKANQRSTYWLSLPWRYSLPLITTSAWLHWLISRSLFLVKINVFDMRGEHSGREDIAACGFSPLAIILVMTTLAVMLFVVTGFASRKLRAGIPVVGTCSWAISAACHDTGGEVDAVEKPLVWGVTEEGDGDLLPGHCSITSRAVTMPIEGRHYR